MHSSPLHSVTKRKAVFTQVRSVEARVSSNVSVNDSRQLDFATKTSSLPGNTLALIFEKEVTKTDRDIKI